MNSDSVLRYGVMRRIYILSQIPRGCCVLCLLKGAWHFFSNFDVIFLHKKGMTVQTKCSHPYRKSWTSYFHTFFRAAKYLY